MNKCIIFFVSLIFSQLALGSSVVLVTGASRGIGISIVEALAADTNHDYLISAGIRDTSDKSLIRALRKKYPSRVHIVTMDVTNDESVKAAVAETLKRFKKIDALVNNAGVEIYGSLENVTIKEAEDLFAVNFFGVMRVTQEVLPHMRARHTGRIIQLSSRSGFRPYPSLGVYAASKFAMAGLSETMAALLKPWNIYVSLIEPGPVNTMMDYLAPYGSRLSPREDPYLALFQQADMLHPNPLKPNPNTQEPNAVAQVVKKALEDQEPLFRYQTAEYIENQAKKRLVDISGNSQVQELEQIIFSDALFRYRNQSLLNQ